MTLGTCHPSAVGYSPGPASGCAAPAKTGSPQDTVVPRPAGLCTKNVPPSPQCGPAARPALSLVAGRRHRHRRLARTPGACRLRTAAPHAGSARRRGRRGSHRPGQVGRSAVRSRSARSPDTSRRIPLPARGRSCPPWRPRPVRLGRPACPGAAWVSASSCSSCSAWALAIAMAASSVKSAMRDSVPGGKPSREVTAVTYPSGSLSSPAG